MDLFVGQLCDEFPSYNKREGTLTIPQDRYDIVVREFASWWTDGPNPSFPETLQEDFSGSPYHITSLSNAFQILTTGRIIPGPGKHERFGKDAHVIYVGFPDFPCKDFSPYGSVSFRLSPHALFGTNSRFHYRYTIQHKIERSHLFLLSNGQVLPNVALRRYLVGCENNGIWWVTKSADGQHPLVHFRKKDDFEFIEFAVLKSGSDDSIPLEAIDGIRFQRKRLTLGNDSEDFNDSEQYLILSLALYYLGSIPDNILKKFNKVNVGRLVFAQESLMEAFEDVLEDEESDSPFKDIVLSVDQAESPVQTICRRLGEYISNQAHVDDVPTFWSSVHYLRQRNSWMLAMLKDYIEEIFRKVNLAVEQHNLK